MIIILSTRLGQNGQFVILSVEYGHRLFYGDVAIGYAVEVVVVYLSEIVIVFHLCRFFLELLLILPLL